MAVAVPGVTDVWLIGGAPGPLETRILPGASLPPFRVDVGQDPVRVLSGVVFDDVKIQNLSASPIDIGTSRSLGYGQGLRIPPRSQWSPRFGISSIGAADVDRTLTRPPWHDRNPTRLVFTGGGTIISGTALTTAWTYTVPAKRLAQAHCIARAKRVAASAGANPSQCFVQRLTNATEFVVMAEVYTNGVGDGPPVDHGYTFLAAGDQLKGLYINQDAGPGGSINMTPAAHVDEFDA